jgi:acyl-CoA synthetase (AMP-forming)/AMP-acid ligase II
MRRPTGMGRILQRSVQLWPSRPAVALPGARYTYAELGSRARGIADQITEFGVPHGARLPLACGLSVEFFEALFGCGLVGVVPVPVNTWLSDDELAGVLDDCGSPLVLCDRSQAERIRGLRRQQVWILGEKPPECAFDPEVAAGSLETDALQLYTSGTTGQPKGVVLSSTSVTVAALSYAFEKGFVPDDRLLISAPVFFSGSIVNVIGAFAAGAAVEFRPGFDPVATLERLGSGDVSILAAVPTMIYRLVDAAKAAAAPSFGALRLIMYGGGPMTPELLNSAMRAIPCQFWQGFGLTEATVSVTALRPGDHRPDHPGLLRSVGRPVLHATVDVVDEQGHPVPPGEIGEVVTAGPHIMDRYWRRPEQSAEALAGGWLHTGDLGSLDEQGFLFLHGRRSALIVSGGVNVYPGEIEDVLRLHDEVRDCAVVGVPDAEWGEIVVAVVCAAQSPDLVASLGQWCRERLPRHRRPKRYLVVADLPRTASGKTSLRELRPLVTAALADAAQTG